MHFLKQKGISFGVVKLSTLFLVKMNYLSNSRKTIQKKSQKKDVKRG